VQQQMIEQEVQCKNKQEMKYKWDTRIYDFWLPLGNNEELNNVKKKVTMVPKHTLVQISLYPWLNGQYMLPY
jgi:hypothetical protein